jgi:GTPase
MDEIIDMVPVRSGYVMILGLPNVGKSTLMNKLVAEKLAIVTPKPQTTRNRILGIAQGEDYQVLFLDTPGVCRDEAGLNRFLLSEVDRAFADADLVVMLTEAHREPRERERAVIERLKGFSGPTILAINKVDKISGEQVLPRIETYEKLHPFTEFIPISATQGHNVDRLFELVLKYLPLGPRFFPEDEISDVSERFLAGETIREKVFLSTREEIPYSTAVQVTSFKEDERILRIQADIVIEKSSQKGIIIGKGGLMLKAIGTAARLDLEKFFAKKVHLELFVRVVKNWSRDDRRLRELGYS